jgi:hypothetical protein
MTASHPHPALSLDVQIAPHAMLRQDDEPYFAGYLDRMSLRPGDPLVVHLASHGERTAHVDVYRIVGRTPGGFQPKLELVARVGEAHARVYACDDGGLPPGPGDADVAGCAWEPTTVMSAIPETWQSGLYLVQFTASAEPTGRASARIGPDAMFVLRPGAPTSAALVQVDVATWNAYHVWHNKNLYHGRADDDSQLSELRAHTVSFRRPGIGFQRNDNNPWGMTPAAYHWAFAEWAQGEGLALDYCTGLDIDTGAVDLGAYRAVVTLGHDEYWTGAQRDAIERFVAAGGNAIFLGGNIAFWQIRHTPEDQTISCYKRSSAGAPLDPLYRDPAAYPDHDNGACTVEWHTEPVCRPSTSLMGLSGRNDAVNDPTARRDDGTSVFCGACWWWEEYGGPSRPAKGFTVLEPAHWIFEGAGVEAGDVFGVEQKLIGYECDGLDVVFADGVPRPSGRDGALPGTRIVAYADCRDWAEIDYATTPPQRVAGRMRTECSFGGVVPLVVVESEDGGGTIVNTAATDWPLALVETYDNTEYRSLEVRIKPASPVVKAVTRTVLRRLAGV